MMNKNLSKILLITVCLLFALGGISQAQFEDRVYISRDYTGNTGDQITVPVIMDNPFTGIEVFGMKIMYQHTMLELVSCEPGVLNPGWRTFDCDESRPGEINILASANAGEFIPPGSLGSLVIFTFTVTCDGCENGQTTQFNFAEKLHDIAEFRSDWGLFTFQSEPDCINSGDTNLDGEITAGDAQLAFSIVLGTYTPTYEEECAADCNGDGEVTASDAQSIFLVVLGLGTCADPLP